MSRGRGLRFSGKKEDGRDKAALGRQAVRGYRAADAELTAAFGMTDREEARNSLRMAGGTTLIQAAGSTDSSGSSQSAEETRSPYSTRSIKSNDWRRTSGREARSAFAARRSLPLLAAALLLTASVTGCSGGGTADPASAPSAAETGKDAAKASGDSGKDAASGSADGKGTDSAAGKSADAPAAAVSDKPDEQPGTVYYEVFVRSFYDSNGDGIGDLKGLNEKLD